MDYINNSNNINNDQSTSQQIISHNSKPTLTPLV